MGKMRAQSIQTKYFSQFMNHLYMNRLFEPFITLIFAGFVSINSSQDPTQLYFVRGNSILMTSRLQDVDKISGKPIEYTRLIFF